MICMLSEHWLTSILCLSIKSSVEIMNLLIIDLNRTSKQYNSLNKSYIAPNIQLYTVEFRTPFWKSPKTLKTTNKIRLFLLFFFLDHKVYNPFKYLYNFSNYTLQISYDKITFILSQHHLQIKFSWVLPLVPNIDLQIASK